ncbi:hypothetical protein BJV78DRAFT_1260418 [Lactifluus subvellereus]|nr:hypothetical protein BJV78DRAFT_1260418 [Lactifluus subvellereus]
MKFITTIVALSFAVLALAAQLPVDQPIQPQENLKRTGPFGGSLEDSAPAVGNTKISVGGDIDPLPVVPSPM